MKKLLIIIMITGLLAGCGSDNFAKDIQNTEDNISSETPPEDTASDGNGEIKEIKILMQTQEYDGDNIVEIPVISYESENKNSAIDSINDDIKNNIQIIYNEFLEENAEGSSIEIKTYPFTNDEFLQLVITHIRYPNYGTDGDISSYCFDKKENRVITYQDELEKMNLTKEGLTEQVKALFEPFNDSGYIGEVELEGFIKLDNMTTFLLKVEEENPEIESWMGFYGFTPEKNELKKLDSRILFAPQDMDEMSPPLNYAK